MGELYELLDEEQRPAPPPPTRHDAVAAFMLKAASISTGSRRFEFTVGDSREWVAEHIFGGTGRLLSPDATWLRFVDMDRRTGLLAVLNGVSIDGEADLIVLSGAGVLCRGLIRDLCRWAFYGAAAHRVVARVPTIQPDLSDLLRRAGFDHDGVARDFYGAKVDASVWSMSVHRCRWLAPAAPELPAADAAPLVSLQVH